MLSKAKALKIKIFFTLFSFECANNGNCHEMITDAAKTDSYLTKGLSPLLTHLKSKGYDNDIYAFEILNEPEWMVTGEAGINNKINLKALQSFVKKANHLIVEKGFKATVGSASLKWSCNCGPGCEGNWWGETGLSFVTVHYYDWMVTNG